MRRRLDWKFKKALFPVFARRGAGSPPWLRNRQSERKKEKNRSLQSILQLLLSHASGKTIKAHPRGGANFQTSRDWFLSWSEFWESTKFGLSQILSLEKGIGARVLEKEQGSEVSRRKVRSTLAVRPRHADRIIDLSRADYLCIPPAPFFSFLGASFSCVRNALEGWCLGENRRVIVSRSMPGLIAGFLRTRVCFLCLFLQ